MRGREVKGVGWKYFHTYRAPPSAPKIFAYRYFYISYHQKTSTGYLEKFLSGETKVDPVSFA